MIDPPYHIQKEMSTEKPSLFQSFLSLEIVFGILQTEKAAETGGFSCFLNYSSNFTLISHCRNRGICSSGFSSTVVICTIQ